MQFVGKPIGVKRDVIEGVLTSYVPGTWELGARVDKQGTRQCLDDALWIVGRSHACETWYRCKV